MTLELRCARPEDAGAILALIGELAAYERLSHEATASRQDIERALFGPNPKVFCDMADIDGEPVGFALWFYNFSTFVGRHGLYLEDLYVRPQARGAGVGGALLAGLARRCVAEGLGRLDWAVLDWNAPAIGFYEALDAARLDDWTLRRLTGEALVRLAQR